MMLRISNLTAAVVVTLASSACSTENGSSPDITGPGVRSQISTFAAPSGLVSVVSGVEAFPYTTTGFSTTPQDPINVVFTGAASDPRQIRAILLGLAGSGRPGPLAGFDCTWSDAVGDPQTGYSANNGWVGSVVQL